ncbi:hypothetical protein WJU23_23150 [Prosthecobacter sp. SYSU 5D2]|uniref:hypothetical protein n=1 Tax=Prosthecobacter sp. SYSU 5D2 TaxID=3134134 RepID=UPI0031FE6342
MTLTEYAQLGDALGGILGTIVAFASVAFVYYAYREQVRSNDQMRIFQIEQRLRADIDSLRSDLSELHYHLDADSDGKTLTVRYTGRAAIETFAEHFSQSASHDDLVGDVFFQDLYFFIGRVDTTYSRIISATVDPETKHELIRDLAFLYSSRCLKGMTLLRVFSDTGRMKLTVTSSGITMADHLNVILRFHDQISKEIQKRMV